VHAGTGPEPEKNRVTGPRKRWNPPGTFGSVFTKLCLRIVMCLSALVLRIKWSTKSFCCVFVRNDKQSTKSSAHLVVGRPQSVGKNKGFECLENGNDS